MRILNLGSLNIDIVYDVPHMVRGGETISATGFRQFFGGKGLNQSIALARAGAPVLHAGCVGRDGDGLMRTLRENGVDITHLRQTDGPSGHAFIQVDGDGQNAIIVHGGANHELLESQVDQAIDSMSPGDIMLCQNETNLRDYGILRAAEKGIRVAFNPSPVDEGLRGNPILKKLSFLLVNETEGLYLSGEKEPEAICRALREALPSCAVVLTLGEQGSMYCDKGEILRQSAYRAQVVDTTAAGDTFTGYFLASLLKGEAPKQALDIASRASAIAVSRKGATSSIPLADEVNSWALETR